MTDLHSQASEEALKLALQIRDVEDEMYADPNAPECDCYPPIGGWPGGTCDFCMDVLWRMASVLDRVSRERTRQALERAATRMEELAQECRDTRSEAETTTSRTIWSIKVEMFEVSRDEVRALLSDGESVASEEKEE